MSWESCCCFCIVSAHLIADIGALGSHDPHVTHHAGLAHAHVDANAAETTDACSHARFSCTGTLLQLRGRLMQRKQVRFTANGRLRCVLCDRLCGSCVRACAASKWAQTTFSALCAPPWAFTYARRRRERSVSVHRAKQQASTNTHCSADECRHDAVAWPWARCKGQHDYVRA